jgi:CHAT domain-containing protein/tetratricopeptide (TPR) repeat protein
MTWVLRVVVIAVVLGLAWASDGTPQESASPEDEARKARLAERDRIRREAWAHRREGETTKALEAFRAVLAIEREVLGEVHEDVARSLASIGRLLRGRGEFAEAREVLTKRLEILSKLHGPEHWKLTRPRLELEDVSLWEALTEEQRRRLDEADRLSDGYWSLIGKREYRRAASNEERALEIRREILGGRHHLCVSSLQNLGGALSSMKKHALAARRYEEAVAVSAEVHGRRHPWYGSALDRLAGACRALRQYDRSHDLYRRALAVFEALPEAISTHASCLRGLGRLHEDRGHLEDALRRYREALEIYERVGLTASSLYTFTIRDVDRVFGALGDHDQLVGLHRRALEARREALGEEHVRTLASMVALATLHHRNGEFADALPLARKALAIARRVEGEHGPIALRCLRLLASVHRDLGDDRRAEGACRELLEIARQRYGESHAAYAAALHRLGSLYWWMEEYERAEPLWQRTLAIRRKIFDEERLVVAESLHSLGGLYIYMEKFERAEPLLERARDIRKRILGEEHALYASSLNSLALLYKWTGRYAEAEPLYREYLRILEKVYGEGHWQTVVALMNLGSLHYAREEFDQAEPLYRRALEIRRWALSVASTAQSETQQLRMSSLFLEELGYYASLARHPGNRPARIYDLVLSWKGLVLARQSRLREARASPEIEALFEDLERTSRRLATLGLSDSPPARAGARRRRLAELSGRKQELEIEISRLSTRFRRDLEAREVTPDALRSSLPPGVALVDFLVHHARGHGKDAKEELLAFVTRRDAKTRCVDLGRVVPIREALDTWRAALRQGRPSEAPGAKLRRLVWEPLQEAVAGAKTILISPEDVLNRLPFAALPGEKPGTYLLEDVAIAVVPVPQLLPELLERKRGDETSSLLLIGEVDYTAPPGGESGEGREAPTDGVLPEFEPLDAARAEIAAIRDSFEMRHGDDGVRMLRRKLATEAAFREHAPEHRWLHIATHGFFAPPELRSALAAGGEGGHHPGLLSGLALAGANVPATADGDDGILTALEVAALDLSDVEVAVLSACETGLGEVAAGEGVMGLQRAFQVAGARTTVTSLWKVPDVATQLLMQRFYENLWDKGMGKLEALRQAQLWLMREGGQRGVMLPEETTNRSTCRPTSGRPSC